MATANLLTESQQLEALKAGDHAMFNFFYEKYSLQLYRRLLNMVQVDVIAEELLQELFTKVWERREQLDPLQSFKAYLYRIAERLVYDHYRRLTREAKLERDFVLVSTELYNPIEESLHIKEGRRLVQQALDHLPKQQRRVFTLCKLEGRSYEEVSKLLGISTASINTHISRASKTVRKFILKNRGLASGLLCAYAIMEVIQ